MNLSELGEFGLIGRIRDAFRVPGDFVGIGDDCAVLPQADGRQTLVSTDMLVEGTHFLRDAVTPQQLGWKCGAVNFSDIAAMGGTPEASFLSVALPGDLDSAWTDAFIAGYREISNLCEAPLLGGDTTASPDRICVNVTVLGSCPTGAARLRSAARPGDLVCVTGTLGDSGAGLRVILEGLERTGAAGVLVERHLRPVPRVREGLVLAAAGIHAMMDVSDGIASDLRHILKASGVGAQIDTRSLPLSPEFRAVCGQFGWDALELALAGGEDYELLFTMAPGLHPDVPCTVIGQITEGEGLAWLGTDRDFLGYSHF